MIEDVRDVRTRLRGGQFRSRGAVAQGVVLRLLGRLGWPTFDPEVVIAEYGVGDGPVDFALFVDQGPPAVLIDVHAPSRPVAANLPLLRDARATGAAMLLQTDGAEWRFDLLEAGAAGDPLAERVNLFAADLEATVAALTCLLDYGRVRSGEAVSSAREACRERDRRRRLEERLPEIWNALVADKDPGIVALVVARVLLPKLRIATVGDDPPAKRDGRRRRSGSVGQLGLGFLSETQTGQGEAGAGERG